MAMTTAQATAALRHVLQETRNLQGNVLISSDVTDNGTDVITFKILSPAGTPLSDIAEDGESYTGGVGETVKTVTLTVVVS